MITKVVLYLIFYMFAGNVPSFSLCLIHGASGKSQASTRITQVREEHRGYCKRAGTDKRSIACLNGTCKST